MLSDIFYLTLCMLKKVFFVCVLSASVFTNAQNNNYAIEAAPVGGKEAIQQVLQTQLTLPKTILTSNFDADVTAYFNVDSAGAAHNVTFGGQINNLLRKRTDQGASFHRV